MTCATCSHEADVHDGRCYAPHCLCERYVEHVLDPELGHGSGDGEADYYEQVAAFSSLVGVPLASPDTHALDELFPAQTKLKDEPTLPLAVVYPSRSGRPWAHVVTVVDHPTKPYLTCNCRGFAMHGSCWASARVTALVGVETKEEVR
jgi:hypothetical protein